MCHHNFWRNWMRRWGAVVVILYVAILSVLTIPVWDGVLFFPKFDGGDITRDMLSMFSAWGVWVCLAVALVAQAALLSVPVEVSAKRPVTKRTIGPVVISTALAMAVLVLGMIGTIGEVINKDLGSNSSEYRWIALGLLLVMWAVWSVIFFRWSKGAEPKTFVERQCKLIFRGSILELLVAVPCHIVVRQRSECCAGVLTGAGIALGIAVMFFSFGPGVFYLFVSRVEQLKRGATR